MIGRILRIVAVLLVGGVLLPQLALAASKIGVTAAAQNEVSGIQGGATQTLVAGSQIFQDETVSTGPKSMAQLLFLDETSLSVGPQSQVKLDKFVFNPAKGTGSVVLSATKGAFRFITGSQAPTNYELKTAVATIGVRGTIVDCYLSPAGLYCIAQEGKVIITVDGVAYTLGPNQALFVGGNKQVTGPMPPDDKLIRVVGTGSWPLYGGLLPGDHERFDVPDGATVRTDDLFTHPVPCYDEYCCTD